MWLSKIVRKMCGPAVVTGNLRTVSLAEWERSGMPIYPEEGYRNRKDDGLGTVVKR